MSPSDLRTPTVPEYAAAFRAVGPDLTDHQRALLRAHHAAPARVATATTLAGAAGLADHRAVNRTYGGLARAVREALDLPAGDLAQIGVLVDFVPPGTLANEHWLWVLRTNVAGALEALGWVPPESHLLYPHGTTPRQRGDGHERNAGGV